MTRESIVKNLALRGYEVEETKVVKNGVTFHGIHFLDEKTVSPVIYLEQFFELAEEEGLDEMKVTDEVIKLYESKKDVIGNDVIDRLRDKQWVLDHVRICIQKESTQNYIKKVIPEFEGLEAYLIVILESNQEETLSTVLKEGYQFFIGLSENELWKKAYQNLCEDTCLQGMTQIMNEFMGVPVLDEEEGMFVISNKSRFKGASAILNRQVLEDFANRRKVNRIFVLPSSIHECILVLDNGDLTLEELSCMVTQVNASEVASEEQLPNRAYVLEF